MGTHFIKMTNSELSTKEPQYDEVTIKVRRTITKKMAEAVGIKKGSPSSIIQTFLNNALTI